MKDPILRPCPFCGGPPKYIEHQKLDGNLHYTAGIICCDSCGCRTRDIIVDGFGRGNNTKEDVINIWNRRE